MHCFMHVLAGASLDELRASIAIEMTMGPDVALSLVLAGRALPQTSGLALANFGIEDGAVLTATKRPAPRLLTALLDKAVKVWNPVTGESTLTLSLHMDGLISANFYSDASLVRTAFIQ